MTYKQMLFARISKFLLAFVIALGCWLVHGAIAPQAHALTSIKIANLAQEACPALMNEGLVTSSGSARPGNCFLIKGTAINSKNKTIYDVNIYGRIYDANHNTVLANRTRVGGIPEVPPGKSNFEIRITVPASQKGPLQLEQFKASGFSTPIRSGL
ncbi:MAG: hypothetical protein AAGF24_07710 [Cyanobacteria bacterium P01_H01_bin.121]